MEFKKNQMINEVLENYYLTFERTLDTCDFVPDRYNKKILSYIFKNMKQKFKNVDRLYKIYTIKQKIKKQNLGFFDKIYIFFNKSDFI